LKELFGLSHSGRGGPDRGEIERAPFELAALDGEQDRWRVGIPEHLLDIEAERIAQDFRHVGVACAFPGAAEHPAGRRPDARLTSDGDLASARTIST